jgi:uncharacterized protein (DUF885 family)
LARLESALSVLTDVARAVIRHEVATARIAELSAVDAQHLSGADFIALGDAQDAVKASREFLARVGLLHLVEEVA